MAFYYLEIRVQRGVIKCVRYLAKSAADIRDYAAFTKFTAFDVSFKTARTANVFPKAEDLIRRDLDAVKLPDGEAKIMYFARN